MAISHVGYIGGASNNPLTGTFQVNSQVLAGDLIIAQWYSRAGTKTFVNNDNINIIIDEATANGGHLVVGWWIAASNADLRTFNSSSVSNASTCWGTVAFRGPNATTPFRYSAVTPGGSSSTPDPPSCSTGSGDTLVIGWGHMDDFGTVTKDANFTISLSVETTVGTDASSGMAYDLDGGTGSAVNPGAFGGMSAANYWYAWTGSLDPSTAPTIVAQTLTPTYNIRQGVAQTLTPVYNIVIFVSQTFTPTYNVREAVVQTLSTSYQIRAPVSQVLTPDYDIQSNLSVVNQTLSPTYNVQNLVTSTLSSSFDIRQVIVASLSPTYSLFEIVGQALSPVYILRALVNQTLSPIYGVRALMNQTLSPIYGVRALANQTLTPTYNVLENVNQILNSIYDVRENINQTLNSVYDVRNVIIQTLTPTYFVLELTFSDLSPVYNIDSLGNTLVSQSLIVSYDIRKGVAQTLIPMYLIRELINNNVVPVYSINELITSSLVSTYNINMFVTQTLTLVYDSRQMLAQILTPTYNSRQIVGDILISVYDIYSDQITLVSQTLSVIYDLFNRGLERGWMLPGTLNIEVVAGDGYRNTITFKDDLGEIIDVSMYTFSSQIRRTSKSEVATDFDIDNSDGINGTIVISLSGTKVRALGLGTSKWDIEFVTGDSDPKTILSGKIKVLPDITRIVEL